MKFATVVGPMQVWPVLNEYSVKLMGMSEAELIEHYDAVKKFYDLHSGIAWTLGAVGVAGAIKGRRPKQIMSDVVRRGAAGGAVGDAVIDRGVKQFATRFPGAAGRLKNIGSAMTGAGAGLGIIAGVVYVATIAEAADKLKKIASVASIKYRNGEISETGYRHILDLHPTEAPPELYYE